MSVNTPTAPAFTLIDTPTTGLEDVQRAALYVLVEGLANALTEIEGYWVDRDTEYDTRMGTTIAPTTLEAVPLSNFHEGHKPSLLKGTPDDYPNLSVFATRADPGPENNAFDQADQWAHALLVEVMAKASDEDTVNRRTHRMAEATVLCLRRNKTLGGAVSDMSAIPSIAMGDVFAVRSPGSGGGYPKQDGTGQRWIWQGAQINFRIRKDSVLPSSGADTFSSASTVDYGRYVDQG